MSSDVPPTTHFDEVDFDEDGGSSSSSSYCSLHDILSNTVGYDISKDEECIPPRRAPEPASYPRTAAVKIVNPFEAKRKKVIMVAEPAATPENEVVVSSPPPPPLAPLSSVIFSSSKFQEPSQVSKFSKPESPSNVDDLVRGFLIHEKNLLTKLTNFYMFGSLYGDSSDGDGGDYLKCKVDRYFLESGLRSKYETIYNDCGFFEKIFPIGMDKAMNVAFLLMDSPKYNSIKRLVTNDGRFSLSRRDISLFEDSIESLCPKMSECVTVGDICLKSKMSVNDESQLTVTTDSTIFLLPKHSRSLIYGRACFMLRFRRVDVIPAASSGNDDCSSSSSFSSSSSSSTSVDVDDDYIYKSLLGITLTNPSIEITMGDWVKTVEHPTHNPFQSLSSK